ncbi:sialidase family protein [Clostridium butyricum]|nr:sialidase family protein [Clostridium butyricum]MDB2162320.1 sialidase family protein [Clostridium butyricum]
MKKNFIKKLSAIFVMSIMLVGTSSNTIFAKEIEKNNEIPAVKVFNKENNIWNSKYFRIPSMQTLSDGSIIAFSDIRYNGPNDHGYIDIGCARSVDGGKTWGDYKIVMENDRKDSTYSRVMDSTTVVTNTGRIILLAGSWNKDGNWAMTTSTLREDWSVQMVYSDDNGETWSKKVDLTTNSSKIKNQRSNTIGWLCGVGSGIVMDDGTIVMPAQIALKENNVNNYYSTIIYSKDNGETWTMGNKVT